jgi:hypothetical protein
VEAVLPQELQEKLFRSLDGTIRFRAAAMDRRRRQIALDALRSRRATA